MPGNTLVGARSISRPIQTGPLSASAAKGGPPWAARVLAVFERACHLVTPGGDVLALVLPEIGDGPLNIVLDGDPGLFRLVEPGTAARLEGGRLHAGGLQVALDGATIWEPCPDWDRLRARRAAITTRLPRLQSLALQLAPDGSLLPLVTRSAACHGAAGPSAPPASGHGWAKALPVAVSEATRCLAAGWQGDPTQLQAGAARLAGLGGGLTPAGDDFLAGLMLWAWLAHPDPDPFCQTLLAAAVPRTTTLSAAFLRASARGECSAAWHRLLAALSAAKKTLELSETPRVSVDGPLAAALQGVLSHGHTSGADTLAGFLGLESPIPEKIAHQHPDFAH